MATALITGSSGLIGSETARFFHEKGFDVVGIDNDMRRYFFGAAASTDWNTSYLCSNLNRFTHHAVDIRDRSAIEGIVKRIGKDLAVVVHAAAQPSHDWAAREPFTDFSINAEGTLVMLESARLYAPEAVFIFTSTNKVYGDAPNTLPLVEEKTRWEIQSQHPFFKHGINETLTIDQSKHSVFGASKVAADILCQEYGRYFGLKTGTFRGGCLTGPAHSGAELHGFLAYLVTCALTGKPYTIYGYKGKQVRDNIHSHDLVNAFWHYFNHPRPGAVYNMGGSRHSNCSVLEAIDEIEKLSGMRAKVTIQNNARSGDHIWWISDVRRFQEHYPQWSYQHDLKSILKEIIDAQRDRLSKPSLAA